MLDETATIEAAGAAPAAAAQPEAAPAAAVEHAARAAVAPFEALPAAAVPLPVPAPAHDVRPEAPARQRLSCPHCARPVRRCRRTLVQRWLTRNQDRARYRCTGPLCGWSGLLTRRPSHAGAAAAPAPQDAQPPRR